MDTLLALHHQLNSLVWGPPMIILLIAAGVTLTIATGGIQFRRLLFAFRQVLRREAGTGAEGTVTAFQALSTALAATVGVGNIAGVSTAIALGGPGALFWLFVSGVAGMATKFAEITIAVKYRERDGLGVMRGGAMYVLSKGLGMRWLGALFAVFTALAGFGIGNMVQANSVADAAQTTFGAPPALTGAVLAILTALVVLGGIRRIAEVAQVLVPGMCAVYLLGALVVLATHLDKVPGVFLLVLQGAADGQAAVGGFAGAGVAAAVRYGIARGLFSNEAGLGSAPLVHASAVTDHPVRQGLYGIVDVFVDTVVVCMLTGFVVLATGAWETGETGAALTAAGFRRGLPGAWGDNIVAVGVMLFAFSTTVAWAHYGETGASYLLGTSASLPYRLLWVAVAYLGATVSLETVWSVADTLNGLMAVPNLIGVLGSLAVLRRLLREFLAAHGERPSRAVR